MICTRCNGTGFLNIDAVDDETLLQYDTSGDETVILAFITANPDTNVCMCDCCSDGDSWYNIPGEHDWDNPQDPKGCR